MMVHAVTPPLFPVRDTTLCAPQEVVIDEVCSILGISRCNLNVQASFVALGGHSLSAVQLASRCRKRGNRLSVGRILVSKSISELIESSETESAESEVVVEQLDGFEKQNTSPLPTVRKATPEREWLDRLDLTGIDSPVDAQDKRWQQMMVKPHRRSNSRLASTDQLPPVAPKVALPPRPLSAASSSLPTVPVASELQLSLIHGSIKNPGTNIIQHFETYYPRDVPRMKEAWRRVLELEPILSTRYKDGYSYSPSLNREQHVDDDDNDGSYFDWTEIYVHEPTLFDQLVGKKPTAASVVCSFKVITLVNSHEDKVKSTIIWTVHHALIDGYSAGLVFSKVQRASAGKPIAPGPSFALLNAELKHLRSTRKAEGDAFWQRQQQTYSKAAHALQLPAPLEPERGTNEHVIHLGVTPKKLAKLAQRYEATPAALFYTAWILVLSLYADCDDVVFGMVLSGRNLPLAGIEDTVGPFVNTLPLVVSLDRASSVRDLVTHVFDRMNDLAQYQWTTPENGYSRHFQSALAMQFGFGSIEEEAAAPIEPPYSKQSTDVPLSLAIQPDCSVSIMYFKNQFNKRDIERIGELYSQAIYSLLNITASVNSYRASVMTLDVHQELRAYGNSNCGLTIASAVDQDLVTLFEQSAKASTDQPALEKGSDRLTYGELNRLANIVASALSAHIKPNEIVCVDADRSPDWIIAIFGILKAGGVYCPLDTALPDQLRTSMFEMTKANVFLAPTAEGVARAPSTAQLSLVVQDILSASDMQGVTFPSRAIANPSADAYVCFTSGSTGTPKGVVCSHEGLVAFQRDLEVRLFAQPGVKVSQLMSVAFDGSIHEIFSALCHGATLVLQNGPNPFGILGAVDSAILTPSVAQALDPQDFPNLRNVSKFPSCLGMSPFSSDHRST
jgi:gliotoxin/aspirochlorine biosynthesis peptide synthetase